MTAETDKAALRGILVRACFDPGIFIGPRGSRTTDEWRADACLHLIAPVLAKAESADRMAGELAAARAEVERLRVALDEAQTPAKDDLAAGNEGLRAIGAFDRKTVVGKHRATNYVHLRAVIGELDAAGQHGAADTLIWQVWHRVNSVARAREILNLEIAQRHSAEDRAVVVEAESEGLRTRVERTLSDVTRMDAILLMAGEMTTQERRTAKAVADGIANKVRTALARSADKGADAPEGNDHG